MARPKKKNIVEQDGRYYVTQDVAAQMCGVSKQTWLSWRKQPDPPPYDTDKELTNIVELTNWIRQYQVYKKGRGGTYPYRPDPEKYDDFKPVKVHVPGFDLPEEEDQDIRLKRLRADKLQIEIDVTCGHLVNADEAQMAMSAIFSRVKTRILSLPQSIATIVVGKSDRIEIQDLIEDKVQVALSELANNPLKALGENEL